MTAEGVGDVSFENVPSFLLAGACSIDVPGLGPVTYDLAYGGAFYAYVDAGSVGLRVDPSQVGRLIAVGMDIKRAIMAAHAFAHPDGDEDLNFLYGVIFTQPADGGAHLRNVCIFANGEVDRSPTGTGVSGRAAIEHARGRLNVGEPLVIESLIGTRFSVRAARETRVGDLTAARALFAQATPPNVQIALRVGQAPPGAGAPVVGNPPAGGRTPLPGGNAPASVPATNGPCAGCEGHPGTSRNDGLHPPRASPRG